MKEGLGMKSGIFASVSSAIGFVLNAHKRYQALSLEDRCEIIDAIRSSLLENLDVITMLALKETCMGNYEDKKVKIEAAIKNTPGIEDLITEVNTGDRGMTLYELSGFGVVCCVESTTNTATAVINHVIGLISAGNAVVVCTNPIAYSTTTYICNLISKAIVNSCGIDNLVVSLDENSICKTEEVMQHPDVDMIVCGAETDVLRSALSCGKKVIAEGSSDSVVLIDETADIKQAAFDISRSASFDNGLIHVSEKTCVYVKSIKDSLFSEFVKNKSYVVQSKQEILKLEQALLTDQRDLKKR
jgi:propionaldehyde dehydrogenase